MANEYEGGGEGEDGGETYRVALCGQVISHCEVNKVSKALLLSLCDFSNKEGCLTERGKSECEADMEISRLSCGANTLPNDTVDHAYHRTGELTLCVAPCDSPRAVATRVCC
jgi:hypothetical protein